MVLEKTLESPLDCKEIHPVHPKGDQSWVFTGRTDVEAETPILWPPDAKSWLIGKDLDAGKDWGQEEKGMTEDEMVGWHHQFNGLGFGWTPGVGDGQGGLACCTSWGRKESDMTERLNWIQRKQCRRHEFDPWVGKIPGGGNGNPLPDSCLGNSMNRGVWWATIHGVAKSQTQLSSWACKHAENSRGHHFHLRKSKKCLKLSLKGWLGVHLVDKIWGRPFMQKWTSHNMAGSL